MKEIDAVAASALASAAIQSALVAVLQQKGILSDAEVVGLYRHALQLIEQGREYVPDPLIIDAARDVIEDQLRGEGE